MPEYKTKETPFDTKPYIVYSGDPDSGIPNGGGSNSPFIEYELSEDLTTIHASFNELKANIEAGKIPCIFESYTEEETGAVRIVRRFCSYLLAMNDRYGAFFATSGDASASNSVEVLVYEAASADADLAYKD